jgi:hypothetical protein
MYTNSIICSGLKAICWSNSDTAKANSAKWQDFPYCLINSVYNYNAKIIINTGMSETYMTAETEGVFQYLYWW